jgi:lipopolysaccharide/colanic/teichoic acid biosynthesis glycosyltransferase
MLNIAHESLGRARSRAMVTRDGVLWRVMEVAVASALLVVVAPLCAAIAVAIFIDGGGSVFFAQPRIGRYGRPFRILKFRTMTPAAGTARVSATPFDQLPDHPRLTRVGRVLRRTHLDELPQLLNVIAGKMSLVGPRPLVPEEDGLVTRIWRERHEHRPGLTGVWQLQRSSPRTVDELISLDRGYIANWSPWQDLVIVACTARHVLRRRGR